MDVATVATGSPAPPGVPLDQLDAVLAGHPFGAADYITGQMHASYERRLDSVSAQVPAAGRVLAALGRATPYQRYRAFGDMVFRCAVQHAQVHVEAGVPYGLPARHCAGVFDETARLLDEGVDGVVGARLGERIGPGPRLAWVWDEGCPADVLTGAFRRLVEGNYDGGLTLCTPDEGERATLAEAVELLGDLLPELSASALSHTHVVAAFDPGRARSSTLSSSDFRVNGTVFLNRRLLRNPWSAADHLFHETLHQQLYDFRRGHTLLHPSSGVPGAAAVHSPWNMPSSTRDNYWDAHRTLAAFHVYVHLALMAAVAEQRMTERAGRSLARYGPPAMTGWRTAVARARYLEAQLRTACWGELGDAGRRLVEWFGSVLAVLDTEPLAPGSTIHLLFDRYWREMDAVEAHVRGEGSGPGDEARLAALADDEVATTRSILALVGQDSRAFDRSVAATPGEDAVQRFVSVRTRVAETLAGACPRPYRLSDGPEADERVRAMVEASSEAVRLLLGR